MVSDLTVKNVTFFIWLFSAQKQESRVALWSIAGKFDIPNQQRPIEALSSIRHTPATLGKRNSPMPFSLEERTALLALKGVGPTVITRLEQMGIESLDTLSQSNVGDILAQASAALGSTCWKNSPQARAAITAAVALARRNPQR
jgi:hypothetical protein